MNKIIIINIPYYTFSIANIKLIVTPVEKMILCPKFNLPKDLTVFTVNFVLSL